jgi:outer membrane biosynthesis protein TonB
MATIHKRGLSLRALAVALLMAGSSSLPAMAALPLSNREWAPTSNPLLLAEKDKDSDEKKKKKNNSQPQKQQQPTQQNKGNSSGAKQPPKSSTNKKQETKTTEKKSDTKQSSGKKSTDQKSTDQKSKDQKSTNTKTSDPKKVSNKERERIYQEGREDGLKKGKKKGFEQGKEVGLDKGKDKGYRKAQRQQWEAWNRDQWTRYNKSRRNVWISPVQYNKRFYGYPGWARNPNWGYNRPWGGGWYNSSSPSWSWWGGQALGWGVNALTTALIVNSAINNAIRQQQPTVLVPNTTMQLYYGSVEPIDETGVTFVVNNGGQTYQMQADCADGLLNDEVPTTIAEAELVNAACQVTFGSQI